MSFKLHPEPPEHDGPIPNPKLHHFDECDHNVCNNNKTILECLEIRL